MISARLPPYNNVVRRDGRRIEKLVIEEFLRPPTISMTRARQGAGVSAHTASGPVSGYDAERERGDQGARGNDNRGRGEGLAPPAAPRRKGSGMSWVRAGLGVEKLRG